MIKERQRHNTIQISLLDSYITSDANSIGEITEHYFKDLFSAGEYYMDETLFSEIQPMISANENGNFCRTPSIEDICQAIQQLNPDSAPGNDSFSGHFTGIDGT